jgi:hypothetical protein
MGGGEWLEVSNSEAPHLGGNLRCGDLATFCPNVWDFVIRRFAIESVLDLGSGSGNAAHYFFSKGLKVMAVDGLRDNIEHAVFPTLLHDLTQGPVTARVDLVHCQEVVEHIEERYLDHLLGSLMCGKYILMTNALPGQGGFHHVNEQPTEYWIDHLARRGCQVLVEDSNRIRHIASGEGARYLAASAVVYANSARF